MDEKPADLGLVRQVCGRSCYAIASVMLWTLSASLPQQGCSTVPSLLRCYPSRAGPGRGDGSGRPPASGVYPAKGDAAVRPRASSVRRGMSDAARRRYGGRWSDERRAAAGDDRRCPPLPVVFTSRLPPRVSLSRPLSVSPRPRCVSLLPSVLRLPLKPV